MHGQTGVWLGELCPHRHDFFVGLALIIRHEVYADNQQ